MIKVKLLSFTSSVEFDRLIENFIPLKYTEERGQGINIVFSSNSFAKGTFYEMTTYRETIHHPIEGTRENVGVTYFATSFHLYNDQKLLCIQNSQRRTTSFLTFLSLNIKSFFVSDVIIDTVKFCDFAPSVVNNFKIKKITFPTFNLTPDTKAFFAISSKEDAFKDLKKVDLPLPEKPKKIFFDGAYLNKKTSGEISSSGAIALANLNGDKLLEYFLCSANTFIVQQ